MKKTYVRVLDSMVESNPNIEIPDLLNDRYYPASEIHGARVKKFGRFGTTEVTFTNGKQACIHGVYLAFYEIKEA